MYMTALYVPTCRSSGTAALGMLTRNSNLSRAGRCMAGERAAWCYVQAEGRLTLTLTLTLALTLTRTLILTLTLTLTVTLTLTLA